MANRLIITMPSGSFAVGVIDGACDSIIKGLSYYYKEEKNTEYLILRVEKEIKMTSSDNENKTISIQPESVIIFAIDRRN